MHTVVSAVPPKSESQPEEMLAVLLTCIAVHSGNQGQRLGAALLKHFMLKVLGWPNLLVPRVLLTTKDDEVKSFYTHSSIRLISPF